MSICKVISWIGLEILILKHLWDGMGVTTGHGPWTMDLWKSKIRPLQPILALKRYVPFFLGHPVEHVNLSKWYSDFNQRRCMRVSHLGAADQVPTAS